MNADKTKTFSASTFALINGRRPYMNFRKPTASTSSESIQLNHEWTRIDTNKDRPETTWCSRRRRSPNGEALVERRNGSLHHPIRVYSCPFVVLNCMDTASSSPNKYLRLSAFICGSPY